MGHALFPCRFMVPVFWGFRRRFLVRVSWALGLYQNKALTDVMCPGETASGYRLRYVDIAKRQNHTGKAAVALSWKKQGGWRDMVRWWGLSSGQWWATPNHDFSLMYTVTCAWITCVDAMCLPEYRKWKHASWFGFYFSLTKSHMSPRWDYLSNT